MDTAQSILNVVPMISPNSVPKPALPALSILRRSIRSPAAAPIKGPSISLGREKNMPMILFINVPRTARLPVPVFFVPHMRAT